LGYGQKDTVIIKPNDSLVTIPKGLAIEITKDLIKKDYLEQKVVLLEKDTAVLSQMFAKYTTELAIANKKEEAYKSIIADNNKILSNFNNYIVNQDRELKITKAKSVTAQIFLLVTTIFIIVKL
jgi:hypothetical protein